MLWMEGFQMLEYKNVRDMKGKKIAVIDFPGIDCEMYPAQIQAMINDLESIKNKLEKEDENDK